jgi:hypothetical protein
MGFFYLSVEYNAVMIRDVQISLSDPTFNSFGYAPGGITGSYNTSIFNFLRNHYPDFHSGCTILLTFPTVQKFQLHTLTNVTPVSQQRDFNIQNY